MKPIAFEFIFTQENNEAFDRFNEIKKGGSRIWLNSLWASMNAGHDDDLAERNTKDSYGWLIGKGANIIQTDRPKELMLYLQEK